MRCLEPGHRYELDHYRPGGPTQVFVPTRIAFFKKVGEGFPGNEEPQHTGTNCQEVLRALIDRVKYLGGQAEEMGDALSVRDDREILHHLRMSLVRLEVRAARRKGTTFPACHLLQNPEDIPTCPKCGHVYAHDHVDEER